MTPPIEGNPLLEAWTEVYGPGAPYNTMWSVGNDTAEAYKRRREVIARYSFAIPTPEAVDVIAEAGPVVEIGAGTGYWAALLRARGTDVLAYDPKEKDWRHWFPNGQVDEVLVGDHAVVKRHPDRTLLMVWPSMASWAAEALQLFAQAGGQRVVYVGEGQGGCTANEDFFALIGECWRCDEDAGTDEKCEHPPALWQITREVAIPQWEGIHDRLWVLKRTTR